MNKTRFHIVNVLVLIVLLFFNLTVFWATAGLSEGGMILRDWIYLISPFIIWGILYSVQLTRHSNNQRWFFFAIMVVILLLWQVFAQNILRIMGLH